MANRDLKLAPHHVGDNAWWYEEPSGITVLIQDSDNGIARNPVSVRISWKALRNALARKDAT